MVGLSLDRENAVLIGRLGRPFGVRGWLHLKSLTDQPTDILQYKPWIIFQANQPRVLEVLQCQAHGKNFIAQIDTITDRDQAETLTNQSIYLAADQLPRLPADEYYLRDLLDMKVKTKAGDLVGRVVGLIETMASHDVLRVSNEHGHEHLIPWRKGPDGVIAHVDLEAGDIVIHWTLEDL